MKYIWEAEDIKPGRYYYRDDQPALDGTAPELSYLASVTHKIGFASFVDPGPDREKYVSISMTDGLVCEPQTKEAFAEMLNSGRYVPLRTDRLVQIIAHCARQNEGV